MSADQPEVIDVMAALKSDGARVAKAGTDIYKAQLELEGGIDHNGEPVEGVSHQYQDAWNTELCAFQDEVENAGRRMPAADIREARVNERMIVKHPELRARFFQLEATVNLLRQVLGARKTSIGAWQSVLRGERE